MEPWLDRIYEFSDLAGCNSIMAVVLILALAMYSYSDREGGGEERHSDKPADKLLYGRLLAMVLVLSFKRGVQQASGLSTLADWLTRLTNHAHLT